MHMHTHTHTHHAHTHTHTHIHIQTHTHTTRTHSHTHTHTYSHRHTHTHTHTRTHTHMYTHTHSVQQTSVQLATTDRRASTLLSCCSQTLTSAPPQGGWQLQATATRRRCLSASAPAADGRARTRQDRKRVQPTTSLASTSSSYGVDTHHSWNVPIARLAAAHSACTLPGEQSSSVESAQTVATRGRRNSTWTFPRRI